MFNAAFPKKLAPWLIWTVMANIGLAATLLSEIVESSRIEISPLQVCHLKSNLKVTNIVTVTTIYTIFLQSSLACNGTNVINWPFILPCNTITTQRMKPSQCENGPCISMLRRVCVESFIVSPSARACVSVKVALRLLTNPLSLHGRIHACMHSTNWGTINSKHVHAQLRKHMSSNAS